MIGSFIFLNGLIIISLAKVNLTMVKSIKISLAMINLVKVNLTTTSLALIIASLT